MLLDFDKKWKNGQTIRVKFVNGGIAIQNKVMNVAKRWIDESGVNLKFDFVGVSQEADVRIEFGKPTKSLLGNELLTEKQNRSNLTFKEENAEGLPNWKILHEFGHVLGLIHEIFSPAIPFKLKYDELKDYYMGVEGYSEVEYEVNVGKTFKRNEIQFFDFDKDSIMMYHLPAKTNENNFEYVQPNDLSLKDLESIKIAYPEKTTEIIEIKSGDEIESNLDNYTKENIYKFSVSDVSKSEIEARRTANCSIEIIGDLGIALGIFKIEIDGLRSGFYTYISPARENEALGKEFHYDKDLTKGEYILRIQPYEINSFGKYKLKFKSVKNPDD